MAELENDQEEVAPKPSPTPKATKEATKAVPVKKIVKKKVAKSPTKSPYKAKAPVIKQRKEPVVSATEEKKASKKDNLKEKEQEDMIPMDDDIKSESNHYSNQSFDSDKEGDQSLGGGGDVSTVKKDISEIRSKDRNDGNKSNGYTSIDDDENDAMEDEIEKQF